MQPRYEVLKHNWDGEVTYRLLDREAKAEAEVIPAVGFNLFRFDVRDYSYIVKPDKLAVLRDLSSRYGVPILFPPGRVRNAAFTFEGRDYRLPLNREPHHIHGELRYKPWKVTASGADAAGGAYVSAEIDFAEHEDLLAYFPHAACFRFTYRLQAGRLTLSGEIANRSGTVMPLGLGFHPYFSFAAEEAANVKVIIPAAAEWPLEGEGFVAGPPAQTSLCTSLQEGIAVTDLPNYKGGSQILTIQKGKETYELVYGDRQTKLIYDSGDKFPIHVLFTPDWTNAVSLEPYTCIPDAFNSALPNEQTGAFGLGAGDTFAFEWSIHIESI